MCQCDSGFLGRVGQKPSIWTPSTPPSPDTSALLQDYPVFGTQVFELPCAFNQDGGLSLIESVRLLEVAAADADVKRAQVRVHFFNQQPTSPTAGAAYNIDETKHVGSILVSSGASTAAQPFLGYRRLTSRKHEAHVHPSLWVKANANYSSLWMIVLADAAVTYVTGTTLQPTVTVTHHV